MAGMESQRGVAAPGKERTVNGVEQVDNDAEGFESLYSRCAWHVAERMLETLGSSNGPRGFKPEDFVKRSFEETFDARVPARSLKRKWPETLKIPVGCSVVDAVLGTMGFDSTAMYDRELCHLTSVFTSSVNSNLSCSSYPASIRAEDGNANTTQEEDLLSGEVCSQRMSARGFLHVVESCAPLQSVAYARAGRHALQITKALLYAAVNISVVTPYSEASHLIYKKVSSDESYFARGLESVLAYARDAKDDVCSKLDPCSRLIIWRLHPYSFKEDISRIARQAMEHPTSSLSTEFRKREDWTVLVACLALAPDVFGEARRLLHTWFSATGSVRLLELRAELVTSVWSLLNNPPLWGFAEEVQLSPQHAFYNPNFRPFIVILRCCPTLAGLDKVMDLIDREENVDFRLAEILFSEQGGRAAGTVIESEVNNVSHHSLRDSHDSLRAQVLDFLPWLRFASRVLFWRGNREKAAPKGQDVAATKTSSDLTEGLRLGEPRVVAARFMAWMVETRHSSLRSSIELVLLQLSKDWDKTLETPSEETHDKVVFDDHHYVKRCSRCGIVLSNMKRQKSVDGREASSGKNFEAVGKELAGADAWLAQLSTRLTKLEPLVDQTSKEKVTDSGRRNGTEASEAILTTSSHANWLQKHLCTTLLPLGALFGSLPCSLGVIARFLQFVSCGGNVNFRHREGLEHEASVCSSGCSPVHCNVCCLGHGRRSSESSVQSQVRRLDSQTCLPYQDSKLSDWSSGASAIFDFLDGMHNDEENLSSAATKSKAQAETDWIVIQGHFATVVSQLVVEWVNLYESHSSPALQLTGSWKASQLSSLQDLRSRLCAWLGKLCLTPELVAHCNRATELVDERVGHLHSFLMSS